MLTMEIIGNLRTARTEMKVIILLKEESSFQATITIIRLDTRHVRHILS